MHTCNNKVVVFAVLKQVFARSDRLHFVHVKASAVLGMLFLQIPVLGSPNRVHQKELQGASCPTHCLASRR